MTIPKSTANLNLNIKSLTDLPTGAKYTEKQGQATVTVEKTGENDYKITADCDSLTLLVTEKETLIFHLQSRIKELEDISRETKETIIKEPKPAQWFFIYSGYLFWVISAGAIAMFIIKKKWKLPF